MAINGNRNWKVDIGNRKEIGRIGPPPSMCRVFWVDLSMRLLGWSRIGPFGAMHVPPYTCFLGWEGV